MPPEVERAQFCILEFLGWVDRASGINSCLSRAQSAAAGPTSALDYGCLIGLHARFRLLKKRSVIILAIA